MYHITSTLEIGSSTLSELISCASRYKEDFKTKSFTKTLENKVVLNAFFEPSTRTRVSFEIAGSLLGAKVINFSVDQSSVKKGESLEETLITLVSMRPDFLVIRNRSSDASIIAVDLVRKMGSCCRIVSAGDGVREHPTQALLDMMAMYERLGEQIYGNIKLGIVGDIIHSRVANSHIFLNARLGNDIVLCGPPSLVPRQIYLDKELKEYIYEKTGNKDFNLSITNDLESCLAEVDVVIVLRPQFERHETQFITSKQDYFTAYGITLDRLNAIGRDVLVLHPGPATIGTEIEKAVLYDERCLARQQVFCGVLMRMAVLTYCCGCL